jgi:MFS family permease
MALGLANSGIGTGTLVLVPTINHLISAFGWRTTYLIMATGMGLVLLLAASVMEHSPQRKGLTPYGAKELADDPGKLPPIEDRLDAAGAQEWTTGEAIRTKSFLTLVLLLYFITISVFMVNTHLVPFAIEAGIPKAAAAGALGLVGGISIAGRIVVPSFSDRIGWKPLLATCASALAMLVLWLSGAKSLWMLYVFVVAYGVFYGGESATVPGLTGYLFGTRSLAEIIGLTTALGMIGGIMGPILGGFIFDRTGSYQIALLIAASCYAIAAMLTLGIRPPHKSVSARAVN